MRLLSIALKNIRRNMLRSIIIILSVILLSFIISFISITTSTINKNIEIVNEKLGADLVLVPKGSETLLDEFLFAWELRTFYMKKDIYEKLKNYDEIEKITYQVFLVTLPALCCGVADVQVIAIDPRTDFIIKPFLEKNIELTPGTAYAGLEAWYAILGYEVDTAYLYGKEFELTTNLRETGTGLDYALYISVDDLNDIIGKNPYVVVNRDEISVIYIKLKPNVDPNKFAERIRSEFPEVEIIKKGELGKHFRSYIQSLSNSLIAIVVLVIPMFLLIISTIISISVNERKKEIGIYKALGVTNKSVFMLFMYELLLLIIPSSIIGMVLSIYISLYILPKFMVTFQTFLGINVINTFLISILVTVFVAILSVYFTLIKNVLKIEILNLLKEKE